jgi:hypothetical protein
MRLHIRITALEQLFCTVYGSLFDNVNKLPSAMEAVPGIALESLVRHLVTERIKDGAADDVLGCDKLDLVLLPRSLIVQGFGNDWIALMNRVVEEGSRLLAHRISPELAKGFEESLRFPLIHK